MVPKGAIHIADSEASQVAKRLGIKHAKVMTGFEFIKGRSLPRINGIIVRQEFGEVIKEVR